MTAMVVHRVDRMETEKHPRLQARNVPEAMKHGVAAAAWDKWSFPQHARDAQYRRPLSLQSNADPLRVRQ